MAGLLPNPGSLLPAEREAAKSFHYGIAVALWHPEITESLLQGSFEVFNACGIVPSNVRVHRVPGSYELPLAAKWLIEHHQVDAVVALGCLIRGETQHDDIIARTVARGLMQISLEWSRPVAFGVLTVATVDQARARAGGEWGNKGAEASVSAIKMLCLRNTPPNIPDQPYTDTR
ncbi:MAG: 6,7-dimethyl-8-ribityllumazine synthase [Saprospiraceae bacterium]|jgi:6,7-dimethyl-8-ribityllumazine synthase|nr:6,7-dimethyl-8-ribityllumazine synthase [Saprospiraceae bacterium]MBP9210842.1 6,7-dimethyl-8-ribityllumazine synthase [Saprospiraceae bacterium]MBV6471783.1 6,7-dimethyl-8-ribityllumazine synthase [Saprospiraceae bacterium]